ncbi:hypothetical protein DVA76_19605, partial [Acinetobacter baumannii]
GISKTQQWCLDQNRLKHTKPTINGLIKHWLKHTRPLTDITIYKTSLHSQQYAPKSRFNNAAGGGRR